MTRFKTRLLSLVLAVALILPQSGCASPISASATEPETTWSDETVTDETAYETDESEDWTDETPVEDVEEPDDSDEWTDDTDTADTADVDESDETAIVDDGSSFDGAGDPDTRLTDDILKFYEDEGLDVPEETAVELPEDPLERLQYNIDRLPAPEFWDAIEDPNEEALLSGRYNAFASELADEYYELTEEDQESLDVTRLEAYFAWETSLIDLLAGDSDRQNTTLMNLPAEVYNTATFPASHSKLVFYTRWFYKADEVGPGYKKQLRDYQNLFANNTDWNDNVWFRLNRVARIDEQEYDILVYTKTSRAAQTCVSFKGGTIGFNASCGGLGWAEEQPIVYAKWYFVKSGTNEKATVNGAMTFADLDWHWSSDTGLGPTDPNNTSKRESVGVQQGGIKAYLDAGTHIKWHGSTFGNQGAYATTAIGGIPPQGWFWGTQSESEESPEGQVTFTFTSSAASPLITAYYGSWHYGTSVDSTRSEIHYNIAPKSEWFPENQDLSGSCNHAAKDHCIHVDTNLIYGTYNLNQYQNNLNVKPDPSQYIWHGWYTDKNCTKPAPASWRTEGNSTNAKMLWGWYEKKRDVPEGTTKMELTKSLEQTGERLINNQDTWNIILTQEYLDERPMSKARREYAPLASYLNLVIDQTTSMKGSPLENLNKSLENLVDQVLAENKLRMERARSGDYVDINGNQSDAALKTAMDDHLVHIDRAVGFHSRVLPKSYNGTTTWNAAPTTDAEAAAIKTALTISESSLGSGTGLFAAMDWIYNELSGRDHWGDVHITTTETISQRTDYLIVVMDGIPDVKGERYSSKTTSAKGDDVNSAIRTAEGIKASGVKIYGIWDRGISYGSIRPAVEANNGKGDITKLPMPCSNILPQLFMGLLTSDSPRGGNIVYNNKKVIDGLHIFHLDVPGMTWDPNQCYTVAEDSENGFGRYTLFGDSATDITGIMKTVVSDIMAEGSASTLTTYTGSGSYVYDVISDPFEVTNPDNVQVYAVPRVPANLDADGKPVGVETDETSDDYGLVQDFRYGYEIVPGTENTGSPQTEWINVTDQVVVSVRGNVVKVSGWDYESNALTPFDKDLLKATNADDPFIYKPGNYGYKIVVKIPINARKTFGGNNIETNNSDVSGFYPSIPGGPTSPNDPDYVVRWPENEKDNPDGNPWIKKYNSPKVNLYVDYQIVSDSIHVYAPQTAELLNIVMDPQGSIWCEDPSYANLKQSTDLLQQAYEEALEDAGKAAAALGDNPTDAEKANVDKLYADAEAKKNEWNESKTFLQSLDSYRPDGINNAFVDIDYTFTDPDGEVLGRMHIPHGAAYVVYGDGTSNIEWEIEGGDDRIIQKSGIYNISCTVTPVDTNRAPGGHVFTDVDLFHTASSGGELANTPYYPYYSKTYSPTGSTAEGREVPVTLEKEGSAYLFYLEITAKDTRLLPRQTFDFFEGNEYTHDTENPHIDEWRWVCTDGVTESVPENEPGAAEIYDDVPDFTPASILGSGEPNITTSQVPESAFDDGLALDINGTRAVGETDGSWVPVGAYVTRKCGNINKRVSDLDRIKQVDRDMNDDDNLWGVGANSSNWVHECDNIENCTFTAFQDAQQYSDEQVKKIRYLIHVANNPAPNIDKSTDTPVISKGDTIKWKIDLENVNEETNSKHLASDFQMVDVLPFNNDQNDNGALLYPGGSKFNGDLKYTGISFDMSEAPGLFDRIKNGDAAVYLTREAAARTADEADMTNLSADGPLKWTKAETVIDEETKTVTVSNIPEDAYAFNLVGRLLFGECVYANLTANMKVFDDQEIGDYYHNKAMVYTGNGLKQTDAVETVVGYLYISGTVWEDFDADGLIGGTEKRLEGIPVTLYREYNPDNGGQPDRVIGNLKLTQAFASDQNKIPSFVTESDGNFHFDNVQKGTFYIVADNIPVKYAPTVKGAGTDEGTRRLDSKAEETFAVNTDKKKDNSAIIQKVVVNEESVEYQNIGLKLILGNVKVWKSLDEIYFPTTMTEEEMEDYQLVFLFNLKNTETGRIYKETVRLDKDSFCLDANGRPQVYAEFDSLPLGTYELTEGATAQYEIEEITKLSGGETSYNDDTKTMTLTVTADDHEFEVHARNKLIKDPPGGDLNGMKNWVNVRVPVKLEIKYVGADPISDKKLTSYTFKASDFDPARGGDMIVTYDDKTTISLSEGTLRFEDVVLIPNTVTNVMNSGINKVGISGYYSEKGRTVSDSFKVGVDLKPIHKFQLKFDANGSTFTDKTSVNIVHFGHDENTGHNYVTMGDYKDATNGKLNVPKNFRWTGWNTKRDGTGVNYDALMALDAIGKDPSIDALTLYARWTTDITFDARGGRISVPSNGTAAEKALAGKASGSIPYNLNQSVATRITATKTNYHFVDWNTKPDGSGISILNYGKCTGPVTFYALYYQSDYSYTGSAQVFTAPVNGTYQIQAWGARGGNDSHSGAAGGYATGTVYLTRGTSLYVYVGAPGKTDATGTGAGYNGGADSGPHGWSGGGGGASSVSLVNGAWNNTSVLNNRILVAGGGGGGGAHSSGRPGGTGPFTNTRGLGEAPYPDGGGGGGGYYGGVGGGGDTGGGGGSNFVNGVNGYPNAVPRFKFKTGQTLNGNQTMPAPGGGTMVGNEGGCYVYIHLITKGS